MSLQRQRQYPLRRHAAARHRRLAELPLFRMHDPGAAVVSQPHPGDRRRSDHGHRPRRAHRRRHHRARHRHQPASPEDLLDQVKDSDLPIKPIEQIKEEVEALVGGSPEPPRARRRAGGGDQVGGRDGDRYGLAGGGVGKQESVSLVGLTALEFCCATTIADLSSEPQGELLRPSSLSRQQQFLVRRHHLSAMDGAWPIRQTSN